MPRYTYRCSEGHETEVSLSREELPNVYCPFCDGLMERLPSRIMAVGYNPEQVLTEWMDDNFRRKRAGKPRQGDRVIRPGAPIPQREYNRGKKRRKSHANQRGA